MRPVRPSSRQPPQSRKSVALSIHPTDSPSVIPARPSYEPSVHPPVTLSMTRQSATPPPPPVNPAKRLSDRLSLSDRLYTILPCPSDCPTPSDPTSTYRPYDTPTSPSDHPQLSHHLYDNPTRPSDHPPPSHHLYETPISPSACPSPADCLTATTTRPPIHPSFPTIHHTHDLCQSLAVINGEQSHKSKKFPRAFTNYDLLLCALDASSIYLHDFRRVAPPKSGEDAHITCGKCDFGGATLHNPILGLSYVLPRQWDPGGVSSSPNTPRDQSRTIAHSRYPYAILTGYLIYLPRLRRWQDLRTSHVKLDNFIHGNITGLTTAMKKITWSINVINPALTRPTPTHHERDNPYDRQSSRTNFNATAISYIRVTKNLK